MKFALIAHPDKYKVGPPLQAVMQWCRENKATCFASKNVVDAAGINKPDSSLLRITGDDNEAVGSADVLLAVGGDGTMLYSAQLIRGREMPVLGINCGRLGFMANIHQDRIDESLTAVKKGEYRVDNRSMLEASVNSGETWYALNEFLFTKKDTTSLLNLTARYDDQLINRYWADGLLVASPTGSTAYNLSTGGPIVMPGTPVMVLTPINPHTLTTRPLVLPSGKSLTIRIDENPEHVLCSNDGRIMQIDADPIEIRVKKSKHSVQLVQLKEQNYFDTLRNKLMWGRDTRET